MIINFHDIHINGNCSLTKILNDLSTIFSLEASKAKTILIGWLINNDVNEKQIDRLFSENILEISIGDRTLLLSADKIKLEREAPEMIEVKYGNMRSRSYATTPLFNITLSLHDESQFQEYMEIYHQFLKFNMMICYSSNRKHSCIGCLIESINYEIDFMEIKLICDNVEMIMYEYFVA